MDKFISKDSEKVQVARAAVTNARLQEAKARLAYAKQKKAFELLEAKVVHTASAKDASAAKQVAVLKNAGAKVAAPISHTSVANIALSQAKQSLETAALVVTKLAAATVEKKRTVQLAERVLVTQPPKTATEVVQEKAADTAEKDAAQAGGGGPQSVPPAPGSILPLVLAAAVAFGLYKVMKK